MAKAGKCVPFSQISKLETLLLAIPQSVLRTLRLQNPRFIISIMSRHPITHSYPLGRPCFQSLPGMPMQRSSPVAPSGYASSPPATLPGLQDSTFSFVFPPCPSSTPIRLLAPLSVTRRSWGMTVVPSCFLSVPRTVGPRNYGR